jgi:hypothetical protein
MPITIASTAVACKAHACCRFAQIDNAAALKWSSARVRSLLFRPPDGAWELSAAPAKDRFHVTKIRSSKLVQADSAGELGRQTILDIPFSFADARI